MFNPLVSVSSLTNDTSENGPLAVCKQIMNKAEKKAQHCAEV